MPLVSLHVAHGQTLEEARGRLETAVHGVSNRFGVRHVEWSPDRSWVKTEGLGAHVDMWVDAEDGPVTGDIPGLGGYSAAHWHRG